MLAQKRLHRDLENLHNDLKNLMQDAKTIGADQINGAVESVAVKSSEQIQQMIKQAEVSIEKLRNQLRETAQKVETTVEEHPYAVIGAALGVGFLLGKFLSLGKREQ